MVPNYEDRHFFMAIGIGILFISPILLLFIPSFIVNSMYLEPGTWVVVAPSTSYWLYGIGFFLLGLACFVLYYAHIKKLFIALGVIILIMGIVFLLLGAKPYIAVSGDGISYREGYQKDIREYSWSEVNHINFYEIPPSEGFNTYEFQFSDGNSMRLAENALIADYRYSLFETFRAENLVINWK